MLGLVLYIFLAGIRFTGCIPTNGESAGGSLVTKHHPYEDFTQSPLELLTFINVSGWPKVFLEPQA
jgi:hypothetical protein